MYVTAIHCIIVCDLAADFKLFFPLVNITRPSSLPQVFFR